VNPESIKFCRQYAPNFHTIVFPFAGKNRVIRTILQYLLIPMYSRRLKLDAINFLGTTGAFFTGCATVQHVKTLHHFESPESLDYLKVAYLKTMLGPAANNCDVIIANCGYTKARIIDLMAVPHNKIITIHEAVDHDIFYPEAKDVNFRNRLRSHGLSVKPYILFVSTLWQYKNLETLLKAFGYARIEHDLVVVGDTPDRKYKDRLMGLCESYGIRDRVKMVGHIQNRDVVRDFYIGADLYVSPSLAETFGLTILESMACGTPVIASNATSIPEVVADAGILFDPYNYKDIAQCIQRVLDDPVLSDELRNRGLQRAKQFNWNKTAKETLRAYEVSLKNYSDQLKKNSQNQYV
jgi:glycosyltransferase involved in cell wall biosynthesis